MPLYGTNFVSLFKDQVIIGIKNFLLNVGFGTSNPQAKLHIDGGDATASNIKFTAGATTGQTATDGFNIGISNTGVAEIKQLENNSLSFFTNNISRLNIDANGDLYLARNANIFANTPSTSVSTGALVVAGGVGVNGNSNFGGNLIANFLRSNTNIVCNNTIYLNTALQSFDALGTNALAADLNIRTGQSTGNAASSNLIFSTTVPGSSGNTLQNWQERARFVGNNGNFLVGTNTDNGIDKLQVNGGIFSYDSLKANLTNDGTVLSVYQNNNIRSLIFGNQGLVCNTVATFGKNTRSGSSVLELSTASPGLIGLLIQGVASQAADLQQWRNSSNNVLANIDNFGNFFAQKISGSQYFLPAAGVDTPYLGFRSAGTKLVLFPNITSNATDLAIGVEAGCIWFSVGNNTDSLPAFNFYGGATKVASISNKGIITGSQFRLSALNTAPISATDIGIAGEIRIDANFIYFCTAANTWKRATLTTW